MSLTQQRRDVHETLDQRIALHGLAWVGTPYMKEYSLGLCLSHLHYIIVTFSYTYSCCTLRTLHTHALTHSSTHLNSGVL